MVILLLEESNEILVPFLISVEFISQPAIEADLNVASPSEEIDDDAFAVVDVVPSISEVFLFHFQLPSLVRLMFHLQIVRSLLLPYPLI